MLPNHGRSAYQLRPNAGNPGLPIQSAGLRITGADIQMSFVAELAGKLGKRTGYPAMEAWIARLHARPAYKAALERGGPYALA